MSMTSGSPVAGEFLKGAAYLALQEERLALAGDQLAALVVHVLAEAPQPSVADEDRAGLVEGVVVPSVELVSKLPAAVALPLLRKVPVLHNPASAASGFGPPSELVAASR